MDLQFEAASHTYRLAGTVLPSVTQILAPLYDFGGIPRDVLERRRQIGVALDEAILLDLADDLDDASLGPELQGPFEAWRRFRLEQRFECRAAQKPVVSTKYRYAGTPDAWGLIGGVETLADWKATAAMHPAVALQTAAYAAAGAEMGLFKSSIGRCGVLFGDDGRYIIERFKDKVDFAIFLSLLSLHNWRARHGLLKGPQ